MAMYYKVSKYDWEHDREKDVYKITNQPADMRSDVRAMICELREICAKEEIKLYRLAWRMTAHGCDPEHIRECREEAHRLGLCCNYWEVLNPFVTWQYAFKC